MDWSPSRSNTPLGRGVNERGGSDGCTAPSRQWDHGQMMRGWITPSSTQWFLTGPVEMVAPSGPGERNL